MNIKIIPITENILEKDFPSYISKQGYKCLRFVKRNKRKINYIFKEKIDYNAIGRPDFFIYNKKESLFCEFKSNKDSLINTQFRWFINNDNLPKAIAVVLLELPLKIIRTKKMLKNHM